MGMATGSKGPSIRHPQMPVLISFFKMKKKSNIFVENKNHYKWANSHFGDTQNTFEVHELA